MKRLASLITLLAVCAVVAAGCVATSPSAWDRLPKSSGDVHAASDQQPAVAVTGDAVRGQTLFETFQPVAGIACSTCHHTDSDERLIGPGLLHLADRAGSRVPGLSAADYVHQSIIEPDAYVVDGYADLMPKNWRRAFSDDDLDDLVAYLLSLSEPSEAANA